MSTMKLKPEQQSLYPTRDTLEQVLLEARSSLPIVSTNQLQAILMTYHNTLLSQVNPNPTQDSVLLPKSLVSLLKELLHSFPTLPTHDPQYKTTDHITAALEKVLTDVLH